MARRGITNLGCLRRLAPSEWAEGVSRAVRGANGHVERASRTLGVSESTLRRWLADPRFEGVRTPER